MKFRKKPVVIDAVRCKEALRAFEKDWSALPAWLSACYEKGGVVPTPEGIYLPTLEGSMLANPDDWIVHGVKGEVYPVKPDIFEMTYEPFKARCVETAKRQMRIPIEAMQNQRLEMRGIWAGATDQGIEISVSTDPLGNKPILLIPDIAWQLGWVLIACAQAIDQEERAKAIADEDGEGKE